MTTPATMVILVVTALASLYAFQRPGVMERWIFDPHAILARKEYHRLITCGLIHADWVHFGFNAFSCYSFARNIELVYGATTLLLIYGGSILGGSLLSLLIHRRHEYRALGASGGVCGIIFASIFLLPGTAISVFPLPIAVPAWLYAVLFLAGSFVAHRRQADNLGHDAHLGGAIVGLLVATALYPKMIFAAPWMFAAVLVLSFVILALLLRDPLHLIHVQPWPHGNDPEPSGDERSRRYQENNHRNQKLAILDQLLDKVARGGVESLSKSEQRKMRQLSQELYGRKKLEDDAAAQDNDTA